MRHLRYLSAAACGVCCVALSARPGLAQHTADPPLQQQLTAVRRATAVYQDFAAAQRAGYVLFRAGTDAPLMGEHWVNRELLEQPVDLLHPAVLQYTRVGDRRVLVGVTYGHWQRPGDPPPEGFAGPADQWHAHNMAELIHQLTRHEPWYIRWAASRRVASDRMTGPEGRPELAMLHVWLWSDNPDGLFANYNPALPYLRAGLPTSWARSGDYAAARGIDLLGPDACARSVERIHRLVDVERSQRRALGETCARTVEQITAARRQGIHGDSLNAVAVHAWRQFAVGTAATLTPEQRQELESLRSGMMGGGHQHDHGGH